MGWRMKGTDKPDKGKVYRSLERLTKGKLAAKEGGSYRLTAAGTRRASVSVARELQ